MKVMPSVLGQVGQNVADNLYEIGKSTVKGTVGALADIASGSVEQLGGSSGQGQVGSMGSVKQGEGIASPEVSERRAAAKRRYEEVREELALYVQRKKQLDAAIERETVAVQQQEMKAEEQKHESWVSKVINRSQTNTEKGRLQE